MKTTAENILEFYGSLELENVKTPGVEVMNPYQSSEVMDVCEQFYLKPKDFDLLFLGQFLAFSEHYNGTKEFHPNLTYLAPTFPSVDPHHPAPFLQSYFPEWESSQERLKGVA